MSARTQETTLRPWWGARSLEEGQALLASIGPLRLMLQRLPYEWRVAYRRVSGDDDSRAPSSVEVSDKLLANPEVTERYLVRKGDGNCSLMPALADRSVVSRPDKPFHLPSGEATTLYMSSPAWVRIMEGLTPRLLAELPCAVPSDTWVGSSTRHGEVCYASRTLGRLRLEDVPLRPHRIVTPVTIDNRAADSLRIERVNLPTTHLSLFRSKQGFLWTEAVTLVRESDGELAQLHVHPGPCKPARDGEQLAGPRQPRAAFGLFRAFSNIFE